MSDNLKRLYNNVLSCLGNLFVGDYQHSEKSSGVTGLPNSGSQEGESVAVPVKEILLAAVLIFQFCLYSGYVVFNAQYKDRYGDIVLLALLFFALPRFVANLNRKNTYIRLVFLFFWVYLGLALVTTFFPPSQYIHPTYFIQTFYRFLFAYVIIAASSIHSPVETKTLRWGLAVCSLTLSCVYILDHYGLGVKEMLAWMSPFPLPPPESIKWNDKNYSFWQVFIMWGAISFFWRRSLGANIIAIIIFLVSSFAVFLSTSESAQLAVVISSLVFLAAHIRAGKKQYGIWLGIYSFVVLLPVFWVLLAPLKDTIVTFYPALETKYINAILIRVELYDFCAELIKQKLFLGYGTGCTTLMQIPAGEVTNYNMFPGGHPHNFVFLFFLEYGLVGILYLSLLLFLFFQYVYKSVLGTKEAPAVWAGILAGWVVFSLSFSIWKADVVMAYAMLFSLIAARCGSYHKPEGIRPFVQSSACLLILLFTVAVIGYLSTFFV